MLIAMAIQPTSTRLRTFLMRPRLPIHPCHHLGLMMRPR
ncbi:MAG: hypothetical protein QOI29_4439 [Mycobacterium sp.]|jgi:hypothetical protein|nr:hypothetical protein [Mycobacterium sp.]